ncbi:hypothetical protein ACKWTF_001160 [Chironomus riparius]
MIILKSSITLIALFLLSGNIDARGGGRSGSRGRGGMHHGGGGLGWAFSSYFTNSHYGDSFGSKGLPENSYISKDDYKYKESNGFLISSLINVRWNQEKDKKWRESTRAPYFENKIPGNQEKIPASAIVGAAKAFGLVSLLPLNVPPGKPLMYCGNTDLIQSQIRINNEATYVCNNAKIEISCKTPRPTTTKLPYVWMEKVYTYHDNGTVETTIRPVPKHLLPFPFETDPFIPYDWFKVYTTSTEAYEETTTELKTTTTTEEPYVWMMKVPSDDSNEKERLEPAHSEIVDLIEHYGSYIPENFVKVPRSKAYKFS